MDDLRALEHKHISLWSSDDLTIVEAFDGRVHHSDRGTQYLSMRHTDRLDDAGIAPSVGSRGDSYDNALAESVIGLFKTEVIRRLGACGISRRSNSRRSTGWTGSIIAGYSGRLATCRPRSTRHGTMSKPRWPDSHNSPSRDPGTLQSRGRAPARYL
jgi:transposase InsO family protein